MHTLTFRTKKNPRMLVLCGSIPPGHSCFTRSTCLQVGHTSKWGRRDILCVLVQDSRCVFQWRCLPSLLASLPLLCIYVQGINGSILCIYSNLVSILELQEQTFVRSWLQSNLADRLINKRIIHSNRLNWEWTKLHFSTQSCCRYSLLHFLRDWKALRDWNSMRPRPTRLAMFDSTNFEAGKGVLRNHSFTLHHML